MNTNFKVIIPVFNSQNWINLCIQSLLDQTYKNWESIIIDDASVDFTMNQIKEVLGSSVSKNKFKIMKRTVNVGAMENIFYGANKLCTNDEDIIILLDGDDWLASNDVLEYLDKIYSETGCWLTYGQFQYKSSGMIGTSQPILDTENYRSNIYCSSHLRTFKFKIWKRIKEEDLKDSSGKFYSMAWDMAIMIPLIEMCGLERIKFIEKIMYIYNDENPINDHKKNQLLQITSDIEIRRKPSYQKVKE